MSKVKCIIRQDWETRNEAGELIERKSAVYVTDEDGTPHIYNSISEARAEIVANYGRNANKAGILHNHSVDDYSGNVHDGYIYIVREGSEEYAEAIEQAEQQQAPEYIEPEHIQTVSGHKIYRSVDPVTGWNVFTVAGRDFWELAEARYFAQCNPAEEPEQETAVTARDAAGAIVEAYAAAKSINPADVTAEQYAAAYAVAAAEIIGTDKDATAEQRATVADMVEFIAARHYGDMANKADTLINAYAVAIGEPTPAYMCKAAYRAAFNKDAAPVHHDEVAFMRKVIKDHETDPDALRELFKDLKAGAVYGHQVENVRYPFFWENISMRGDLIRWSSAGSSANAATMHDLAFVIFQIFNTTPRAFMEEYERRPLDGWTETSPRSAVYLEDGYIKHGTEQGPQGMRTTHPYRRYDARTWTSEPRATLADLKAGEVVMM